MKQVWTSGDNGLHWSAGDSRRLGGYAGVLTNVGSTFVAAMGRGDVLSSPDGSSWHDEIPIPGAQSTKRGSGSVPTACTGHASKQSAES